MKNPSPYLTFAGTLPFIGCAILITLGIDAIIGLGETVTVLAVYGLVIATFMAGAHWGNHLGLNPEDDWAFKLPLFSNVIALLLWLGFLSLSIVGFLWLLIVAFVLLLFIDDGLHKCNIITRSYFKIRQYVTLIVVLSLMASAIQL